ncbi:hypothetical protein BGX33_003553 [Mortierella sp. NVP41]|nr:hypothetical protein BGX33_003553 [Mortierella sp. NVP41]
MLRLRLHRQVEVVKDEEYLYLTIGAKFASSSNSKVAERSFTLHNVELTNSLPPNKVVNDYVVYGKGSPDQLIRIEANPTGGEHTATKIRAYGISDKAEFVVTLHLRGGRVSTDPTTNSTTAPAVINQARIDGAVISVWDLRSLGGTIDESIRDRPSWDPLQYLEPCAEIEHELPERLATAEAWNIFHASVSISTNGTKLALCAIERSHGELPFAVFDCSRRTSKSVSQGKTGWTLVRKPQSKELESLSGYGVFHRVNPEQFDSLDSNDNERFLVYNGLVFEVYSTLSTGWTRIHRIILDPDPGMNRALSYGIVQSLRGRYFAWAGANGVVSIWDMEKGKLLSNIFVSEDTSPIHAVLSPDASKIAISVNGSIQIHESSTGILLGIHTRGVMANNISEVVLGNEYFVVKDTSVEPDQSVRNRSVVMIKDMKVIKSHRLHEDYHIEYPLNSTTTIAAYKQGSVLNIRRLTGIEVPRAKNPCGVLPCELQDVKINLFIDRQSFTYKSGIGETFTVTCFKEYIHGHYVMMLRITTTNDHPTSAGNSITRTMKLSLGDTSANFRGFYLPEPSKLVIFVEGYMKIWTLSSKAEARAVCQLDYVWGSLPYQPDHATDYCYRSLRAARACKHGTYMWFRLAKPVWYKNHLVVEGDIKSEETDVITVPRNEAIETVKTSEADRLEYGIFSLIDIYGYGDSDCQADIVRYLLSCIQPSKINPKSCLVPLCNAWSLKNRNYLAQLLSKIIPMDCLTPTWIPDTKATKLTDPLAILLTIAKRERKVIGLVRVVMNYCVAQATRFKNLAFLSPLFGSMHKVMEYYPEDALKCMGRIAYIPAGHPTYIWENHIVCKKLSYLHFPFPPEFLRRIWMSELEIKRMKRANPIMQFQFKTVKQVDENGDGFAKQVFVAAFDALWFYKDKGHQDRRGGQLTAHKTVSSDDEVFGEPLVEKRTTLWKVVVQMIWVKFFYPLGPVVECYDFDIEFFDNPSIAALVAYKWDTIGYPYWLVRFFCQFVYYALVVTAALTQVYNSEPSRLSGVFIAVIAMAAVFLWLEVLQAIQGGRRYSGSHYNFVDLIELRISKGVCKYVTIIQQAVVEIWVFFVIFAGCIVAFTITLLHLRRSCPYEGSNELDSKLSNDWAFHLVMFIFLFSTTILMLNVLIALINVAFGKGDDGWRLAWIESRLRYIESAENLSYHILGFRQTYDWFPKQIYFTATDQEVDAYLRKYPNGRRRHHQDDLSEDRDSPYGDGVDDSKKQRRSRNPSSSSSLAIDVPGSGSYGGGDQVEAILPSPYGTLKRNTSQWSYRRQYHTSGSSTQSGSISGHLGRHGSDSDGGNFDIRQHNTSISSRLSELNEPGTSFSLRPQPQPRQEGGTLLLGEETDPTLTMAMLRRLDAQMDSVLWQAQDSQREVQELKEILVKLTNALSATSS